MRLIDADALLEGREDHEMISTHLIWNAPTIDAEPVRHGRWKEVGRWFCCSECGNEMFFTGTYDLKQRYCYSCGAKMDGGKSDERSN